MFDIESIVTNAQAELEGVWCPFPEGAQVKIARIGNEDYQKLLRHKFKASRAVLEQDDDMAMKLGEEIMNEVWAHTIVKGLKGIAIGGKEITEYTPTIGLRLLQVRDFRDKVKGYAENMEVYRDKQETEAVKNS